MRLTRRGARRGASSLRPDPRAPGLTLGDDVRIGDGVELGANVTVHAGTAIGDGCVIEDNVVLGKRPRRRRNGAGLAGLELGSGVTVCCGAIVFAGTSIGADSLIGDQALVRERVVIGERTLIGRGSCIDNDVAIGDRVSIQTNVYVTGFSRVEDDVFIGPGASTTNDDTMSRHGPDYELAGATLRRACRIGGSAVLVPGVEVGEEAFVAAGAVVTRHVPPRGVAIGVPARIVREVPDEDLLERWR
jgi:acetyltransferase-like isoleucine patch superfamily enzyme